MPRVILTLIAFLMCCQLTHAEGEAVSWKKYNRYMNSKRPDLDALFLKDRQSSLALIKRIFVTVAHGVSKPIKLEVKPSGEGNVDEGRVLSKADLQEGSFKTQRDLLDHITGLNRWNYRMHDGKVILYQFISD